MAALKQTVQFTRQQIEFLNSHYPELPGTSKTPADERIWNAAQRSMIMFLSTRVQVSPGE